MLFYPFNNLLNDSFKMRSFLIFADIQCEAHKNENNGLKFAALFASFFIQDSCVVHISRTIFNESLATNDEAFFIFIWFTISKSGNFDCWLLAASHTAHCLHCSCEELLKNRIQEKGDESNKGSEFKMKEMGKSLSNTYFMIHAKQNREWSFLSKYLTFELLWWQP